MNRYILSVPILLTLTSTAKSQTTEDLERHCKFIDVIDANKANSLLSPGEFSDAYAKSPLKIFWGLLLSSSFFVQAICRFVYPKTVLASTRLAVCRA